MSPRDRLSSPASKLWGERLVYKSVLQVSAKWGGHCRPADRRRPPAHGLDRSAAKTKPLADAGAKVAATAAEVAKQCEAIITILAAAAAIDAVYNGQSGLLSGNPSGKLFIEMSTVLPATEIALAEKVRAKCAALVECPVGGSTGPAKQGRLLGLMGAEPADAARAEPLLDQLCRQLDHCGAIGTDAAMKLAPGFSSLLTCKRRG